MKRFKIMKILDKKEMKIRIMPFILFTLVVVGNLFLITIPSHAAITITGSDTITTNSSAAYTVSGCNGTVTWGVTGTGASINQSGVLTAGGTACGTVLVAARCSADGVITTKGVRVDGGTWVCIEHGGTVSQGCTTEKYSPRCGESGEGYGQTITYVGSLKYAEFWQPHGYGGGSVRRCWNMSGCGFAPLYVPQYDVNHPAGDGLCAWDNDYFIYEYRCSTSSTCAYNITPQAEICGDLKDNNCNGEVDEGCGVCADGETKPCAYTGPSGTENKGICKAGTQTCANGQWGVCTGEVLPEEQETCGDKLDNNCDGNTDEGCAVCEDKDGDGYNAISPTCPQGNDCNDNNASVYPGAAEICDGKDNGCNGEIDEGLSTDADGDGHYTSDSCKEPRDDCNDSNATAYPGAEEICGDGIDNNCDGNTDERCAVDKDGDGYFAIPEGNDPDDNDKDTYPGAPEICDGKDNNGDGNTDEGCCEISVEVSPEWVAPQKTGAALGIDIADIIISLNKPIPIDGCVIDLKTYPVPYSGGHDHHDALRPHGTLDGADKLTIYLSSGEIEPVVVKYKSLEVAGKEEITVTLRETGEKVTKTIDVKVPLLGVLGGGDEWRLTGWTTAHQDNHYGEASAINATMAIARTYAKETEATLGINDMSLKWGGLFDIGPPQGIFWSPPHSSHRKGTSVDIDKSALGSDGWITVDRNTIDKICRKHGGRLVLEATIHCEIIH